VPHDIVVGTMVGILSYSVFLSYTLAGRSRDEGFLKQANIKRSSATIMQY